MKRAFFLMALAGLLTGCGAGGGALIELPGGGLGAIPTRVTLTGQSLELECFLWRDFQPVSPVDGQPAVGVFRVGTVDKTSLAAGFQVDGVSVYHGEQIWESVPTETRPGPGPAQREWISREGPTWPPGSRVKVVVRLRDPDGKALLVKQENVPIHRTD